MKEQRNKRLNNLLLKQTVPGRVQDTPAIHTLAANWDFLQQSTDLISEYSYISFEVLTAEGKYLLLLKKSS